MFNINSNETIWVQYCKDGVVTHITTSNKIRDCYYLYEIKDGQPVKTKHKSDNPKDLEKYIQRLEVDNNEL